MEISLTRLKSLGINNIVLLFTRHDIGIPKYLGDKYGVEVHVYDERNDQSYIPSIKPYLWSKYLQEDKSRENESYFYVDSDVVFRTIPEVTPSSDVWYGSDCGRYLGVDYIDSKGYGIFEEMCNIVGVDADWIREMNPTAGAQWVISNPTYEYWNKVYHDSNHIYRYLRSMTNSTIQKWTAEMWAQLYNVYLFGKDTQIHKGLDFSWSTDPIDRYYETPMLHNAGVVNDDGELFFKGKYTNISPFEANHELVNPNKASIKYVEAMQEVVGYR